MANKKQNNNQRMNSLAVTLQLNFIRRKENDKQK